MAERRRTTTPSGLAILGRAVAAGTAVGATIGAIVGTAIFPVVGTFFVSTVGAVVGAGFGAVSGVVLAVLSHWNRSAVASRMAAATTSGACAVCVTVRASDAFTPATPTYICLCIGLGTLLGPRVSGTRHSKPSTIELFAARGALLAGMCGAVVGLAIGLNTYTYPPTYASTVVAGAILAAVLGAIIGAAAGLACSHRPISRWR